MPTWYLVDPAGPAIEVHAVLRAHGAGGGAVPLRGGRGLRAARPAGEGLRVHARPALHHRAARPRGATPERMEGITEISN